MSREAPPIVKLSERVLVEIELAVRGFARANRYGVGESLRAAARAVARNAHKAWCQRDRRTQLLEQLVDDVDDLKRELQICSRIQAFSSFAQFETLARLANQLGQQCGGWRKEHLKGQNRRAAEPDGRAQILSARDASQGASL
jgi:hypothetical protein